MSKYRNNLPQLSNDLFLTDGGLETTLIFEHGYDLPQFAAFEAFKYDHGYETIRNYYLTYASLAKENNAGFILESATWRASRSWGQKLGYNRANLKEINRTAIDLLRDIRNDLENGKNKIVISGCMGSRGDGYTIEEKMSPEEAQRYHGEQIETLFHTDVDMISAFTQTYTDEAIGITKAAQSAGLPVVISFTIETDGHLPSGESLSAAIQTVDRATSNGPAYYMINCAHPTHFDDVLKKEASWTKRIRGIRANASAKSHAELDEAEELDSGDPHDFGKRCVALKDRLPNLNIFGGCCGTDHRHITEIFETVRGEG